MFRFLHIEKEKKIVAKIIFLLIEFFTRQIVKFSMTMSNYSCSEFQQRIFDTIQRVVEIFITM